VNKWVHSAVELSENNAASTVDVTIHFRPETTVTEGYLFVTFPSGFDITNADGMGVTPKTATTLEIHGTWAADTDQSVTISKVKNPSTANGYGPFSLVTRHE
jgi:hypothetical protein